MKNLALEFPQYGFESNKAYASLEHRRAIQKFGPCREHRKTFGGVKEFIQKFESFAREAEGEFPEAFEL